MSRLAMFQHAIIMLSLLLGACTHFPEELPTPDVVGGEAEEVRKLAPSLPMAFMQTDPDDFANMVRRWDEDVEIAVVVSMERDGIMTVAPRAGEAQIKGNRSAGAPLKPISIKLDDEIDNSDGRLLRVPAVNPRHSLSSIRSFRLRNGGNNFETSLLKDLAYARMLARAGVDAELLYGEPAVLFVNDQFYGLLNLRTEHNHHGLARLMGTPAKSHTVLELDDEPAFQVKRGSEQRAELLAAAINSCDRAELRQQIDTRSLIDFIAVGGLFNMWDWPYKNVRLHAAEGESLRFVLFDFDLASEIHATRDPLYWVDQARGTLVADLFYCLYEGDEDFKKEFDARQEQLISSGVLSPKHLRAELTSLASTYDPVIQLQRRWWGVPSTVSVWEFELERVITDYTTRYRAVEKAVVQ